MRPPAFSMRRFSSILAGVWSSVRATLIRFYAKKQWSSNLLTLTIWYWLSMNSKKRTACPARHKIARLSPTCATTNRNGVFSFGFPCRQAATAVDPTCWSFFRSLASRISLSTYLSRANKKEADTISILAKAYKLKRFLRFGTCVRHKIRKLFKYDVGDGTWLEGSK